MDDNNIGENRPKNKGQFKKGDPRCWRHGRPKSFDALRELAQSIANEKALKDDAPIVISGHAVTLAEIIMRQWAHSKNPQLQKAFVEIAYGKVPDALDLTSKGEALKVILNVVYDDEKPESHE